MSLAIAVACAVAVVAAVTNGVKLGDVGAAPLGLGRMLIGVVTGTFFRRRFIAPGSCRLEPAAAADFTASGRLRNEAGGRSQRAVSASHRRRKRLLRIGRSASKLWAVSSASCLRPLTGSAPHGPEPLVSAGENPCGCGVGFGRPRLSLRMQAVA